MLKPAPHSSPESKIDRYQSASALAADLGNYLARRPVLAAEPPLIRRAARVIRKHNQTLSVSAICTLLAISATSFTVSKIESRSPTPIYPFSFHRFECREDQPVKVPVLEKVKLLNPAWMVTAVNCLPVTTEQRVAVAGGTVILAKCGEILFTPHMDRAGPVAFTYTLADESGHQIHGAIHGNVTAVPDRSTSRITKPCC